MAEVPDGVLRSVLARFAAVAAIALDDPAAWLGGDTPQGGPLPLRVVRRARRLVTGTAHPGTSGWDALSADERSRWWVQRIQAVAAPIAATPRVFGAVADRLPIQGAFGSAVAGLTVCAVAREHGVHEPAAWVPLLGRVLFDQDVSRPGAEEVVAPADDELPGPSTPPASHGLLRRGGGALWRLTRVLWTAPDVFDERPRGSWVWRTLGKVPVVGLAGGVLDERGAVARAARETVDLLSRPGAPARALGA